MLSEKKKCSAKKTNLSASLSISGVVCSAVLRGFLQMLSLSMCVWDDRRQAAGRARGFSELSSLMRKLELWRVCVCFFSHRCTCVCRTVCLWPKVIVWSYPSSITQRPQAWTRTYGAKYRYNHYKREFSCIHVLEVFMASSALANTTQK